MCIGADELYDKTIILFYLVPFTVILLIALLTDLYTFLFTNYHKRSSEQCSTYPTENHTLKDICKICNTPCNDLSIIRQKVDIPLKSTAISCTHLALIGILISISNIDLTLYKIYIYIIFVCVFSTVNIPMIVCLSTRNNFANRATARQRKNILGWNRTQNQQWEIKCALEDRIQNPLLPLPLQLPEEGA